MKTLTDVLKEIEQKPNVEDKIVLYKPILECWKNNNHLVNEAIQGKTTFSKKYQEVAEYLRGWKLYLPNYVGEKELPKKDLAMLEEAIGEMPNEKLTTLMGNPISMPIIFYPFIFGVVYGIRKLVGEDIEMNRREFMSKIAKITGAYSTIPLINGFIEILARYHLLNSSKANAEYLDNIINTMYKTTD